MLALLTVGIFLGACSNTDLGKDNMEVEKMAVTDGAINNDESIKEGNASTESVYTVSGKITGLLEGDKVTEIEFENMDTGEEYVATFTQDG